MYLSTSVKIKSKEKCSSLRIGTGYAIILGWFQYLLFTPGWIICFVNYSWLILNLRAVLPHCLVSSEDLSSHYPAGACSGKENSLEYESKQNTIRKANVLKNNNIMNYKAKCERFECRLPLWSTQLLFLCDA